MTQTPPMIWLNQITLTGLQIRTKNQDEFSPNTAKLPNLWTRFYTEQITQKIPNTLSNAPIIGVYSDYESDATGHYSVTAGIPVTHKIDSTEFNTIETQPGYYLVFEDTGTMPQVVINTWQKIWNFFESQTQYTRSYLNDFEMYYDQEHIAIYIGILT